MKIDPSDLAIIVIALLFFLAFWRWMHLQGREFAKDTINNTMHKG